VTLASRRYLATAVETASPTAVLLALYDGAIRFGREAAEAMRAGDLARKGERISRVLAILGELGATLRHDGAPDLCARLEGLYDYMQRRLVHANQMLDAAAVEEVVRLLETLRDGWRGAATGQAGR
jgi:flagellar secretion chaperone FliS